MARDDDGTREDSNIGGWQIIRQSEKMYQRYSRRFPQLDSIEKARRANSEAPVPPPNAEEPSVGEWPPPSPAPSPLPP